jgi:hypothetical protein
MGYLYRLTYTDGDDAGEVEYPDGGVQAGDEIRIEGNRRMRVRSVIPVERAGEFVDGAAYAVLEIEPVFD